jgi:hypothetical protein
MIRVYHESISFSCGVRLYNCHVFNIYPCFYHLINMSIDVPIDELIPEKQRNCIRNLPQCSPKGLWKAFFMYVHAQLGFNAI